MIGRFKAWRQRRWATRRVDEIAHYMAGVIDSEPIRPWQISHRVDVDPDYMEILNLHAPDVAWPNAHLESEVVEEDPPLAFLVD